MILVNNRLLTRESLNLMRGNHYLVLAILCKRTSGMTWNEIEESLSQEDGKCALSRNTLSRVLNDLLRMKKLKTDKRKYYIAKPNDIGSGYTQCDHNVIKKRILGEINQQQFLVYIALSRQVQRNLNATYEYLSFLTGIDKSGISRYIRDLELANVISIYKIKMVDGAWRNGYTFITQ